MATTTTPTIKRSRFEGVFRRFDIDGDGKISSSELRLLIQTIGEDLKLEDAEELVRSADSDGDGMLDFDDLFKLVGSDGGEEEEGDNGDVMREAFQMYDMDGEGCITPKSLRRMLSKLGTPRDVEECEEMICRFDLNGDGVLTFDEFTVMMEH